MKLRKRLVAGTMLGALAGFGVTATQSVARADEGITTAPDTAPAATSTLSGYQGSAASSGLYTSYNPEGALPVGPIVEIGLPDALATIASGPTTFARAAAADPGDILANPDAVFALASSDYPQGTLPPYPYRVSASSGFGAPTAEASPAPGLNARVDATPEGSTARATRPRADGAAVATFGSVSSTATTKTDGSSVTVHVRTEVTGFNLLEVLSIQSIVTDLTATSDGGAPKLTGGTIVTGASVNGKPVTIDSSGIKGAGGTDTVNSVLEKAGIHVTLAAPVKQSGAGTGQLAATGLRIDLDLSEKTVPALRALAVLGTLPPVEPAPGAPTLADVVVAARARHLGRIEVARGAVSLTAGESTDTGVLDDVVQPLTPDAALPAVGAPLDASTLAPLAAPSAATRTPVARSARPVSAAATGRVPNVPLGAGVGALVLLACLVEPFIGARLARFAVTIIGAGGAASCPWEER
jgi:hypothetical protein